MFFVIPNNSYYFCTDFLPRTFLESSSSHPFDIEDTSVGHHGKVTKWHWGNKLGHRGTWWDTMGHFGRIKFTNHCNIKWRYRSDVSTVEVPLLRIRWPQSIAHLRTIIKTTIVRSVNKEQVEQKNRNVYRDQKAHSYYGNIAHDTLLNCLKNYNKSLAI